MILKLVALSCVGDLLYIWLVSWAWHTFGPSVQDWWHFPMVITTIFFGIVVFIAPVLYEYYKEVTK